MRRRYGTGFLAGVVVFSAAVLAPLASPSLAQAAKSSAVLTPLSPARVVDTRPGQPTVDGGDAGKGAVKAESRYSFKVTGRAGVPNEVSAVMLNVTAIRPAAAGFLTVYPCGLLPKASNVNYTAGSVSPNAVLASVSSSGSVCVHTSAPTDIAVDVSGYVPVDGNPVPVAPRRVLDTRPGQDTYDGEGEGSGIVAADTHIEVKVGGRVSVPADAAAAILNVTAVQAGGPGFLTVYPCGVDRPLTSSVNYVAGAASPNAVVTKIGAAGKVCIYTSAATQILVDVNGYVAKDGVPATLTPSRLMDSRPAKPTVDGQASGTGRLGAEATYELPVVNRGGVAADATAVLLNVTAVQPANAGFVTVFPCGESRPNASNVNYTAGGVHPNAVLAKVGAGGKVCLYTTAEIDVLVDVSGYVVRLPDWLESRVDETSSCQEADSATVRGNVYTELMRCYAYDKASAEFDLGAKYARFAGFVAMTDDADSNSVQRVTITVDGIQKFRKDLRFGQQLPVEFDVSNGSRMKVLIDRLSGEASYLVFTGQFDGASPGALIGPPAPQAPTTAIIDVRVSGCADADQTKVRGNTYSGVVRCYAFDKATTGLDLGTRFSRFGGFVAMPDSAPDDAQQRVTITVDGVQKFRQAIKFGDRVPLDLDVTGGLRMTVVVEDLSGPETYVVLVGELNGKDAAAVIGGPPPQGQVTDIRDVRISGCNETDTAKVRGEVYAGVLRCYAYDKASMGLDLGTRFNKFGGFVALPDGAPTDAQQRVTITVDGIQVFRQIIRFGDQIPLNLDVSGGLRMKVVVEKLAGNSTNVVFVGELNGRNGAEVIANK